MVKKLLVKIFVFGSVISSALVSGITSNAAETFVDNFYSYNGYVTKSKSTMYEYCYATKLEATNSSYTGAYKEVSFYLNGESNGSYYYIDSREKTGTAQSVRTDTLTMSDEVASRIHIAKLHYTNVSSSSVVESFHERISKA